MKISLRKLQSLKCWGRSQAFFKNEEGLKYVAMTCGICVRDVFVPTKYVLIKPQNHGELVSINQDVIETQKKGLIFMKKECITLNNLV